METVDKYLKSNEDIGKFYFSSINYFSISVYILVKTAYTFVCGDRFVVGIPRQTGHCSQTIFFFLQK